MKYTFVFDLVPPNNNEFIRMHRMERDTVVQQWSWLAVHVAQEIKFPLNERWVTRCKIIWRLHVTTLRDWDNAGAMFKAVGDGLRYAGVLKNDNPRIIEKFLVEQVQVKKKEPQWCEVEIFVKEMAPLPPPESRSLPKVMQPRLV